MYTPLNEYDEENTNYRQDQIAVANLVQYMQSEIERELEVVFDEIDSKLLQADLHLFFDVLTYSVKENYCLNFYQLLGSNQEDFIRNKSLDNSRGSLLEELSELLADNYDFETRRISFSVEDDQQFNSDILRIVSEIEAEDESYQKQAAHAGKSMLTTIEEYGSILLT